MYFTASSVYCYSGTINQPTQVRKLAMLFKKLSQKLVLGLLSGTALITVISANSSASAQIASPTTPVTQSQQALQEFKQDRPAYSIGDSNLNLMQLIHNAALLGAKSPQELRASQSESINDAVSQFRSQQTQQLDLKTKSSVTDPNLVK